LEELEEDEAPSTKWLFHWIMMGMGLQGTTLYFVDARKFFEADLNLIAEQ
jgi:hypothetical protein